MQVTLDHTTQLMVLHLAQTMAEEPPHGEDQVGAAAEEVASRHYEWFRTVNAVRLLIGARMTNLALEALHPQESQEM